MFDQMVPVAQLSSWPTKLIITGEQTNDEAKKHVFVLEILPTWVFLMERNLRKKYSSWTKEYKCSTEGFPWLPSTFHLEMPKGRELLPAGSNQWWLQMGREIPQLPHPSCQAHLMYSVYHLQQELVKLNLLSDGTSILLIHRIHLFSA